MDADNPDVVTHRLAWAEVPTDVQQGVERMLGSRIVESTTQLGGFSPGPASRLVLADGRRAFVKAACSSLNPDTPAMHRREGRVTAALPHDAPVPELLGIHDDGEWVVLAFADLEGRLPHQPWQADELRAVLQSVGELAQLGTPSPVAIESAGDYLAHMFDSAGWATTTADDLSAYPWCAANLAMLQSLADGWRVGCQGNTLLHLDLRADNVVLTSAGARIVDWAHAAVGAEWFDLLGFLPSVEASGGGPAAEHFDAHPVAQHADPTAVTSVLAALAGYWIVVSMKPAPQGVPHVRQMQRVQGEAALNWLSSRLSTGR